MMSSAQSVYQQYVPKHNFLSLVGGFNGRLGTEDAFFTYKSETNRNGEKLVDEAIV